MGTAAQGLEKLDNDAAALAAEVKDALEVYRSTKDPEDKQHYEALKQKEKQLNSRRAEMEAKLPVAGARTPLPVCSMLSLLTSPSFARGHPVTRRLGIGDVSRPEQRMPCRSWLDLRGCRPLLPRWWSRLCLDEALDACGMCMPTWLQ